MTERQKDEAEADFRAHLLALGELRRLTKVSWRDLAGQVGVPKSTLESWLRDGKVPDEVDQVKKTARLLLAAARRPTGASTASLMVRLDHVDWSRAHAAVQAARGEGRSRSARAGRAQRVQPHRDAPLQQSAPGRTVSSWTARQLRVHAAVTGERRQSGHGEFVLPAYVPRAHDAQVREWLGRLAQDGGTQLMVLLGGSCTGKTRTAFEAVREVVPDWQLVYPKTARAVVDLLSGPPVPARTVVWLDDLHRLLAEQDGEQAAVLLRELLERPGPVAAVATMWPQNYQTLEATPYGGQNDHHAQARALLACGSVMEVPEAFTGRAWEEFQRRAASDASLLGVAVAAAEDGAVTQILAAGPELMAHWQRAPHVYGKAVITAAIDARRLGVRSPLPESFLREAAAGYLTPRERADADPTSWFTQALEYARRPIKQVTSALLSVAPPAGMGAVPGIVDLADYLEQHAGALRWDQVPPATFFEAAHHLSAGEDLERLALHAFSRSRYRIARDLYLRALGRGNADAVEGLSFHYTETGRILAPHGREELAELARAVNDGGYSLWYLGSTLASIGLDTQDQEICVLAADLLADSVTAGYTDAAYPLADLWRATGMYEAASVLIAHARQAEADASATPAPLPTLAVKIQDVLDQPTGSGRRGIEATPGEIRLLAHRLAKVPTLLPWDWQSRLAELGETDLVEKLLHALIETDSHSALSRLERFLDEQGRGEEAASLLPTAAENGNDHAVVELVSRWYRSQPEQTRSLLERCWRTGRIRVVLSAARLLLKQPWPAGPRLAEELLNRLAQDGSSAAQMILVTWHLEQWQQSKPAAGTPLPPVILTLLEQASAHVTEARRLLGQHALVIGDTAQAEHFFRSAIDGGDYTVLADLARLQHPDSPAEQTQLTRCGLEADGTTSPSW
ncbi:hypothetical protein [Streptomyces sp. PSAA01]|uniref:hypothetical protein n=1 Tax=Streptomyces sp. PSAA01 TaxID=2912762 RepID=UPI001F33FD92|nr:hypothetical protein [Streptomyces sp. PSAA01]MCG0284091.1 hypothetical protein [Streptomyces sp. PSAA01]